ncbi:MAG: DUF2188 domain-containing protein [Candidatus Thermoplasmatota archaeon]
MVEWNFLKKLGLSKKTKKEKKHKEKTLAEYNETVYSQDQEQKAEKQEKIHPVEWRNVDSIEKEVDDIHKKKKKKRPNGKIEKNIDKIIKREDTARKKPNVIYVVNATQPGQVKGDWGVKDQGKIISHHRTKENAIKKARKEARKKDATVLVQKTDGTFEKGFKPKK